MFKMNITSPWTGKEEELTFKKATYVEGDSIAIQVYDEEGFPYCRLTVNLVGYSIPKDCAFIDTNNAGVVAEEFINSGACELIGSGVSGYCIYPLVKFTKEFLELLEKIA